MRTNNRMRQTTARNIRDFFQNAQEGLSKPNWLEVARPFLEEYRVDPHIHWAFYDVLYTHSAIQIKDWGSAQFKLPKNEYGYITGAPNDPYVKKPKKYHSNYSLITAVLSEELDVNAQLYIKQHREMGQASKAMQQGAALALQELTMERALIRLPEMKRFLPEEYRNG